MGKIEDKIELIEIFLFELELIIPSEFIEYQKNFEKRAACERYVEKIVEATVDLAFLFIKQFDLRMPEESHLVFDSLVKEKIIDPVLSLRLKEAKGMRNIISHQYGEVDNEVVFDSIRFELLRDAKEFLQQMKIFLKKNRDFSP